MSERRDESSGAGGGGGGGARAQRKKQRRGGPAQQQARLGTPRGRGQKNRQQRRQQEFTGPSAAFLAALEEQRENERRRQELHQQQQQLQERASELVDGAEQSSTSAQSEQGDQRQAQRPVTTGAIAASAPPPSATPVQQRKPAHIAGFYYDETQKRYFKLTPQMKQRMKQSKQQRDAKERDAATKKALQARRERHSAASGARSTLRGHRGWVGCVAERESSFAWSAGRRDQREMMPRLFASTMATQELQPVHVGVSESRRRITALDFRVKGDYAAMGFSGGRLDIVHIGVQEDLRSGFARRGEHEIRVAEQVDVGASYQISALKWRPGDSLANATHLVCACVGGDSSSSLAAAAPHSRGQNTGFVCLFEINNGIEGVTQKWSFNDPWSIAW